ncbi:GIY-YIG nuclease family protein [Vibrio kasasachensis]|uniref:GIY-YIG nuclease family protein n=1 Tax=Vibrio kasasachensis TaxID=2910248 RepID=UPI003D099120
MSESNPILWSVYLVRMRSDALYCGITTDVTRRFGQHVSGHGAKALKGKGPLVLEWHQSLNFSRSVASKVEYQLKRQNKAIKEALIRGDLALPDVIQQDLYEEIYSFS